MTVSIHLLRSFRSWRDPVRSQALAEAYRPIVRGFLLPGSAYYLFVTWGHWRDETGTTLLVLASLSLLTAVIYELLRRALFDDRTTSLQVELAGLAANLLMYANVLTYLKIHFEPEKLIYFVLMAVVFSTTGVTLRTTLFSITLAIGTLYWLALDTSPARLNQFVFIGVAASFASFGMATLLRKAILRQVEARLAADEAARQARDLALQAEQLAVQDMLTGIANRRAVMQAIEALVLDQRPFWLGILDLDGFKSINDSYGHMVGDRLLVAAVARLTADVTDDMILGRIGGDEFAIIIPHDISEERAEEVGNALIAKTALPFEISQLRLSIGASVGLAHFPVMANSAGQLYEKADYALYRAKQSARGRTVVFNTREDQEMREKSAIERALREADLDKELFLLFQPQKSLPRDRVIGFEALARWQNPGLGAVRPDKFIRAAERAGLIQAVTRILFRKGLEAVRTWPDDIGISFNLSAQDMSDRAFIFSLVTQVYALGIAPQRIEFEITETAVMADISASRLLLEDLSAAGFRIALDDFGSGYSSFEYLDQLPLDKVKIDKNFVRKVPHSNTSREIIAGVINLCGNLGLKCVLEGVETEEELAILLPLKPEIIQGYLFGRPMPDVAVRTLLAMQNEIEPATGARTREVETARNR